MLGQSRRLQVEFAVRDAPGERTQQMAQRRALSVPQEFVEDQDRSTLPQHARGFRERYVAAAERNELALLGAFNAAGTDVLEISTEDDLVDAIRRFADLRKSQRAMTGGGALPPHLAGGTTEELRQ